MSHSPRHIVDSIRTLLARASRRAAMPFMVILLFGMIAIASLGHELERHIGTLETAIANLGPWGTIAFIAFFVVATSFLLPDSVLCVAAGALFGVAGGVLAVVAASLIAAAVQFGLAQRVLRSRISRALEKRPAWAAIQRVVVHDEVRLQVILRLTPINPAIVSYVLGAAGVKFSGFLLASLALTPTLFVEVYLGHAGKHLLLLSGGSAHSMLVRGSLLIGGLILCIAVLFAMSTYAHKALLQAIVVTAETEEHVAT